MKREHMKREHMKRAIAIAALTVMVFFAAGATGEDRLWAQGREQIVYAGFGGDFQAAVRKYIFDPFERETGIRVIDVPNVNLARIKAMVDAQRVEWDVVDIIGSWLIQGMREGLYEQLDLSLIDRTNYPAGTVYPVAIGVDSYVVSMAYNVRNLLGRPIPRTWADFWNTKGFPGSRGVFDNPRYMLEFALMADGVPSDKLYPLDVQRAFRKLDQLKPSIKAYFTNFQQATDLLAAGNVDIGIAAPARVIPLRLAGAPIRELWKGGAVAYDYLAIPRGSRNRAAAMKFIAWYANNAQAQALVARDFPQGPVNPKAIQFLSLGERQLLPTYHQKDLITLNWEWWADNLQRMEELWNEWKLRR